MSRLFITGTGTGVGKTVVATMLASGLGWTYWKPIQTGLERDQDFVARFYVGARIAPSCYEYKEPVSPHLASRLNHTRISLSTIVEQIPCDKNLIIEGAGGLLVPLNESALMIDLLIALQAVPVLVASTALGTINHSLLSLEALRARGLEALGVMLVGEENAENAHAIAHYGQTRILGHIGHTQNFSIEFFKNEFARGAFAKEFADA